MCFYCKDTAETLEPADGKEPEQKPAEKSSKNSSKKKNAAQNARWHREICSNKIT
jgi:hypothetical protein